MNRFRHVKTILAAVLICGLMISSGCSSARQEGFAIYLTKGDIAPSQMPTSTNIEIGEQIITDNDIVSYNTQTHEMKLTVEAFKRLSALEVPVSGKSFVVCVDRKAIYWGAFWTPISSISFDGVTIWKPYSSSETPVVTLELGYPTSAYYGGVDPRNDPEILSSLEQADKLVVRLSLSAVVELPDSTKGYELYSWMEDGQWHFALITGTNRNKTFDEVVAKGDFISEAGWVKVTTTGIDELKVALNKLPENEFVMWLAGLPPPTGQTNITIQLPPKQIYDAIKEYAQQRGLDLLVPAA
jgi:hypothetical protein